VVLPDPCLREWRYDATSRARSATDGPQSPPRANFQPGHAEKSASEHHLANM